MLETVLWVFLGVIVGSIAGIVTISLTTSGKIDDLENEIRDLRNQRELLKEEIHRLNIPKSKPTPRNKRSYRPRNKKR
jgi:cell division protein FtsB|tara:strand:- start:472 stop:705 length:234 start_codon:yes stop_codon:yes gene_type:complete